MAKLWSLQKYSVISKNKQQQQNSTWGAEMEGLQVQNQPGLHSKNLSQRNK